MAKKKKQSKKTAPHPAPRKTQEQGAGAMTTGPRRIVLALVLGGLVAIFVTSFVYRMDHTLERKVVPRQQQEHGDEGQQQAMPPATGGMDAMSGQNGEGMDEIRSLMTRMRENPNDPEVLVALSKRFLGMGDVQSAKNFLERALVADPSNVEAMSLLGMAHFEEGEHEEAAKLLRRLVKIDSDNATHYFNLGMVENHFLHQHEEARAHLEKALELAGEDSALGQRIMKELEAPMHEHPEDEQGSQGEAVEPHSGPDHDNATNKTGS